MNQTIDVILVVLYFQYSTDRVCVCGAGASVSALTVFYSCFVGHFKHLGVTAWVRSVPAEIIFHK